MSNRAEAARRVRDFLADWNEWMRVPGDGGEIRKVTHRNEWDQKVEFTLTVEDLGAILALPTVYLSVGDARVEIPLRQEMFTRAPQLEPSSDPPPSKPQPDDARQ